jgi:hypothetical protein
VVVFPAAACWLAGAGSWVWELMGLGLLELLGAGCTRFGLNTRSRRRQGQGSQGARERGSEGREDEKEFEFGRPEHNQCTIAAEEREGGARDKSSQDKKDKTSRGRDYGVQ